jgi:hypothetical protein
LRRLNGDRDGTIFKWDDVSYALDHLRQADEVLDFLRRSGRDPYTTLRDIDRVLSDAESGVSSLRRILDETRFSELLDDHLDMLMRALSADALPGCEADLLDSVGFPNLARTIEARADLLGAEGRNGTARGAVANPSRPVSPTVLEFADATIHKNGRITMTWPDGQLAQKETGRRDSTVRRMREGLRPFVREFHDRRIDSFTRDEAVTWARPKGANTQQAVRQFFNHALDRDLIPRNQFTRLGASKRKRRVDRPDFEIITDEQYERLLRSARQSRADDYGLVLEGAVLAVGDEAMRPGEVFALHRPELHYDENLIHVKRQIDPARSHGPRTTTGAGS